MLTSCPREACTRTKSRTLGRWRSGLVIHYAGEALAINLASDLSTHADAGHKSRDREEFRQFAEIVNRRLTDLELLDPAPGSTEAEESGHYIVNVDTSCAHWTISSPSWHHGLQRSRCGWQYMSYRFERSSTFPAQTPWEKVCSRCLPDRRNRMRPPVPIDGILDLD